MRIKKTKLIYIKNKILVEYIFQWHKTPTCFRNQAAQGILTYYKAFSLRVHNNPVKLESWGYCSHLTDKKLLL